MTHLQSSTKMKARRIGSCGWRFGRLGRVELPELRRQMFWLADIAALSKPCCEILELRGYRPVDVCSQSTKRQKEFVGFFPGSC